MSDFWKTPSLWATFALVLGILEVLLPGFVLLGFGLGAAMVAGLLWFLGPAAFDGLAGAGYLVATWAVVSGGAWMLLRRIFASTGSPAGSFDHDINDLPYKGDKD